MRRIEVPFPVSCEVAFDYLVDPRNRIQWQSSLRAVGRAEPLPPQVGTRWRERAVAGVVSQMELTRVDRPVRWTERGSHRGICMELTLTFTESADPGSGADTCVVAADLSFTGRGAWRALLLLVQRAFPLGVRADLAKAARLVRHH